MEREEEGASGCKMPNGRWQEQKKNREGGNITKELERAVASQKRAQWGSLSSSDRAITNSTGEHANAASLLTRN